MNKVDKNSPVSSIKHEDKRVAIPSSTKLLIYQRPGA